jgi:hypothetical protein
MFQYNLHVPNTDWFIFSSHLLTQRVPLVEQELLTLLEQLISPLVFSGVRVTQSLVL